MEKPQTFSQQILSKPSHRHTVREIYRSVIHLERIRRDRRRGLV